MASVVAAQPSKPARVEALWRSRRSDSMGRDRRSDRPRKLLRYGGPLIAVSLFAAWFWGILLVGATVLLSVAGSLLVRRWATVEVLECHKEVAGFIYAVIGVLYAVLLGFTAIIVAWLAKLHPLGIILVSYLFAGLLVGADAIQPAGIAQLLQGVILFVVVGGEMMLHYRVRLVRG